MNKETIWKEKAAVLMSDYISHANLILPLLNTSIDKLENTTSELIKNEYNDANIIEDIRLIMFAGIRNQMNVLKLKLTYSISHWFNKDWWLTIGSDIKNEEHAKNVVIVVRDMMFTDLVAFIQISFGILDHAVRTIYRGYHGRKTANIGFITMLEEFFNDRISIIPKSESDEYIKAFKMFSHIRNTIHNNGMHLNEDHPDVELTYNGVSIHFINKQKVEFTFHDLIVIINGCMDAMTCLVKDSAIKKIDSKAMKDVTQKFIDIYKN